MKLASGEFTPMPRCPMFICQQFWYLPNGGCRALVVVLGLN
jgi:hypothetical protein